MREIKPPASSYSSSYRNRKPKLSQIILGFIGFNFMAIGLLFIGWFIIQNIQFNINCTDYMERAAYANTKEPLMLTPRKQRQKNSKWR
jgi:hypothetical protein